MHYQSTRNKDVSITAAEAIALGLARDGGLFVPDTIPAIDGADIEKLLGMTYQERSVYIMGKYLEGFTEEELAHFAENAYSAKRFDDPRVAPTRKLDDGTFFLELWHGPTCAFKDMALQMLPYFLTASLDKTGETRQACILVATSGDTGKAALEGFCDVPRTRIMVFYPRDGVSDVQKLQMTTQTGGNVGVCSVHGNFDDAQAGVKAIFSDEELREKLSAAGFFLSSANSINWGRLLPQIVYYISAYCDLIGYGAIKNGEPVNFCVPTGNFGDILAGYYAKRMGLPVARLICASNKNDVLTEFIRTGVYDKNRPFYTTISPSMDILVSSNLERLLFEISGKDSALVSEYMHLLNTEGRYQVTPELLEKIRTDFSCGFCDEEQTRAAIGETFRTHNYLIDTHTAVAYSVLNEYRRKTGDARPAVVVSTASPYKFCAAVMESIGESADADGLTLIDELSRVTGVPAPAPLSGLREREVRFNDCVEKDGMRHVVEEFLIG